MQFRRRVDGAYRAAACVVVWWESALTKLQHLPYNLSLQLSENGLRALFAIINCSLYDGTDTHDASQPPHIASAPTH